MLQVLSHIFNFAQAGDIENAIASAVTTTTGSLSAVVVTNLPVILVITAGLIGIFVVIKLLRRLVK